MKILVPYNFRVKDYVPFPLKRDEIIKHCFAIGIDLFLVDHFIARDDNGATFIGVVFIRDADAILFKLLFGGM